ncbi:MAG: hypothetical protein J3K34DRAFT_447854 [Monoraphidium minutum]|nr:MAG: hypothetical protein J3K34DRAFT_447854 [Monoraphidium minutum]
MFFCARPAALVTLQRTTQRPQVPYVFHPEYQQVLLERLEKEEAQAAANSSGRKLLFENNLRRLLQQDGPNVDYKFKETSSLQIRINALQSLLDKYKFKDDRLYYAVQLDLEKSQNIVLEIMAGLRNQTLKSVEDWHSMWKNALGLLNVASAKAQITPKGARCGWCSKLALDDRDGDCRVGCNSTRTCSITCPIKYKKWVYSPANKTNNSEGSGNGGSPDNGDFVPPSSPPIWIDPSSPTYPSNYNQPESIDDVVEVSEECSGRGFTYYSTVEAQGNSVSKCEVAVTGPACLVFTSEESSGNEGGYYCRTLRCDWIDQYCNGTVERDEQGEWACLGTCQPRITYSYYMGSQPCNCSAAGDQTDPSGIAPPDRENAYFCFYGDVSDLSALTKYRKDPSYINNEEYTQTREKFTQEFGEVALHASGFANYWNELIKHDQTILYDPERIRDYSGYDKVKSSVLTTNCPFNVIKIDLLETPPPALSEYYEIIYGSGKPAIISYTLLTCICFKGDNNWANF